MKDTDKLMANESLRQKRLSTSSFIMATGLKRLWQAISKTIFVNLHWFEFGFVGWFSNDELYKECSFERDSDNSFERIWCMPNDFCLNGRRSFSETSWIIGNVCWR